MWRGLSLSCGFGLQQRLNVCPTPAGRAADLERGWQLALADLTPDRADAKVKDFGNVADAKELLGLLGSDGIGHWGTSCFR